MSDTTSRIHTPNMLKSEWIFCFEIRITPHSDYSWLGMRSGIKLLVHELHTLNTLMAISSKFLQLIFNKVLLEGKKRVFKGMQFFKIVFNLCTFCYLNDPSSDWSWLTSSCSQKNTQMIMHSTKPVAHFKAVFHLAFDVWLYIVHSLSCQKIGLKSM